MKRVAILCALLVLVMGCSRYKVTDPASGTSYYTEHVEHQPGNVVEFNDGGTGQPTMVMNPKIEKISKKEYDEAIGKRKK